MQSAGVRFGIIGAGAVAMAIAGHLARTGQPTLICSASGPLVRRRQLTDLSPTVMVGTLDQVLAAEVIFLALPWSEVSYLLDQVEEWQGRVLVDATHPAAGELQPDDTPANTSEIISRQAPGAYVVRAFNTLPAAILRTNPVDAGGGRRVLFLSGDHRRAKREIMRLMTALGFVGVDLGPLAQGAPLLEFPDGALTGLNLLRVP